MYLLVLHGFLGDSGTFYMGTVVRALNCALEFLLHQDSSLGQRRVTFLSLSMPAKAWMDVQ